MPSSATTAETVSDVSFWRRAWNFCFRIEPMRHPAWETLTFRLVIAYAAWHSLQAGSQFRSQPVPHGLATWGLDFSWMGDPATLEWWVPLMTACLAVYVVAPLVSAMWPKGRLPWVADLATLGALMVPFWGSVGLGTIGNSQGSIGHTTQIVTGVLLAQVLAIGWAVLRGSQPARLPRGYDSQQLAADWTRQLIMATYVASAITKLWVSKGMWLAQTPFFGLQIAKATGQSYYLWLAEPDNSQWLAQYFIDHPLIAQLSIGIGLPLELFAFLGLHNRRIAAFFGVAFFAFHSTVSEIMDLGFVYHKILLLVLFASPLWWLVEAGRRLRRPK